MSRYAEFDPDPERPGGLEFRIRRAVPDDAPAIAVINCEREGGEPAEVADAIRRSLAAGATVVWVATAAAEVVGYGRVRWVNPAIVPGSRNVAPGFYLTGVVVAVRARRRGIGAALTRARLDWIRAQGATEAFYVANGRNRASIRLHAALGFEEVTRDFACPGEMSPGGAHVLFGAQW